MIDVETTGTRPEHTAILQIAAAEFDLEGQQVGETFDRCMWMPDGRFWDEDTRAWWASQPQHILQGIEARMEDPAIVMTAFAEWVRARDPNPVMWAKPITFEFPLLASYFRQFNLLNPFHFRYATDLQSYCVGRGKSIKDVEQSVEFQGDKHNAIFDVFYQIQCAFKASE